MNLFDNGEMTNLMELKATSQSLSMSEAVELMKEESFLRPVHETLARACGMTGCGKAELEKHLISLIQLSDPKLSRDNVRHNVHLWLGDDKYAIKRDWALRLALVFGLSLYDAEMFLARTCQESFHWRDPRDIAYIYAVQKGLTLAEAGILLENLEKEGLLAVPKKEGMPEVYTEQIATGVQTISSDDELKDFLRENAGRLGGFHNTAYRMFRDYLSVLGWKGRTKEEEKELKEKQKKGEAQEKKGDFLYEDEAVTTRDILDFCLFERLIPRMRREVDGEPVVPEQLMTGLQKELRKGLPEETEFSRMVNRKSDVSRKVMMLLFLATDGELPADGDIDAQLNAEEAYEEMVESWTPEDVVEDRYERMNSMLRHCGFAQLDPRCRFDWICLYCMCVEDAMLIDGRMQRLLSELFETEVDEQLAGFSDEDAAEEDIFKKIWETKFKD